MLCIICHYSVAVLNDRFVAHCYSVVVIIRIVDQFCIVNINLMSCCFLFSQV